MAGVVGDSGASPEAELAGPMPVGLGLVLAGMELPLGLPPGPPPEPVGSSDLCADDSWRSSGVV